MNDEALEQWVGRTETSDDLVTLVPLRALALTLEDDAPTLQPGDAVPPCWHWLYFLSLSPLSGVGPDGHPARGGFLPPVALPRRMWAGSRLVFHHALRVGDALRRNSRIARVTRKQGRTGELVFVQVQHEIADGRGLAISEEHDIVYRGAARPDSAPAAIAARTDEQFSRRIVPDPVLLFRYSALTFNGHRIHYDRPYATQQEGYSGLVVHGPLIATLLVEQLRRQRPGAFVASFAFKAVSPLLDTAPFEVCGRVDGDTASLWARGPDGHLAMEATATLVAGSSNPVS